MIEQETKSVQKMNKNSPWKCIKATIGIHDKLKYKKANKKKSSVTDIITGISERYIISGRYIGIAFGIITLVLSMVSGALGMISSDIHPSDVLALNEIQLTHSSAKERQPVMSPDGQWIAFITTRAGDWDVFKMKVAGDSYGVTRLTTFSGFDLEPSWGSNNKILFSRGPAQHYEDIWVMNADGTGQQRLTYEADFDEYPDWNPSGTKIAYASMGGVINGPKNIWVMNADGSNKHKLNTVFGFQPSWSPDGTRIAFKCYISGSNICVMNADGTNVKQLSFGGGNTHDPDWSPDSKQITYASNKDGDWEIYVMNADGTNVRQLTSNTRFEDNYPAWSPDGKHIIFSSNRTGNDEIWMMDYPSSVPTGIAVTTPNGGEDWVKGTAHNIVWTSTGSSGANVKIELLKNGVLNRVISSSTPNDGSFTWTVPSLQTVGTDYKVRITSTTNSVYKDTSNANFKISAGSITVVSPNGGENWARNTAHTISWTKAGSPGSYVKIELLKGGILNKVITSSTLNDGSFSWTVPSLQTVGTDYKVRITSTSSSSYADISNNYFRIY